MVAFVYERFIKGIAQCLMRERQEKDKYHAIPKESLE
jgi:hypothetical protein